MRLEIKCTIPLYKWTAKITQDDYEFSLLQLSLYAYFWWRI